VKVSIIKKDVFPYVKGCCS